MRHFTGHLSFQPVECPGLIFFFFCRKSGDFGVHSYPSCVRWLGVGRGLTVCRSRVDSMTSQSPQTRNLAGSGTSSPSHWRHLCRGEALHIFFTNYGGRSFLEEEGGVDPPWMGGSGTGGTVLRMVSQGGVLCGTWDRIPSVFRPLDLVRSPHHDLVSRSPHMKHSDRGNYLHCLITEPWYDLWAWPLT